MDTQGTSSFRKSTMTLKEPRRKRRVRLKPRKPFPINIGDDEEWVVYTGHLSNLGVCVTLPHEIEAIHSMGYFGKGSLSRSYPNFEKTRGAVPQVVRHRQWERRQEWLKQAKILEAESFTGNTDTEEWEDVERLDCEGQINDTELVSDEKENPQSVNDYVEETRMDENVSRNGEKATEDPVARMSDESTNSPPEKRFKITTSEVDECSIENNEGQTNRDNEKTDTDQDVEAILISDDVQINPNVAKSVEAHLISNESKVAEVFIDSSEDEDEVCEITKMETVKFTAANVCSDTDVILLNDDKMTTSLEDENSEKNEDKESTEDEIEMLEREILVLPDSDSDIDDYLSKIKPTIQKEGFPVRETLYLTFEEAFFLMFGLGCLQIVDFDGNLLSILEAWDYFARQRNDFVQKYVVYHYFRSNGWVVKPGLKYGGDFLLYKQGPPFYHASYIVIIEVLDGDTMIRDETRTTRKMTWKKLFGLDRLSETAAKEILFAQVIWPSKIPQDEIPSSPEVLADFTVNQLLYRRWIPKQNREEIEVEDENDVLH